MIDSERFFVFYLVLILGPLIGLWVFSSWRDRKLRAPVPNKWLYRCPECVCFYYSDEPEEKKGCPRCGRQNERLKV
jgi:hypothetical protein